MTQFDLATQAALNTLAAKVTTLRTDLDNLAVKVATVIPQLAERTASLENRVTALETPVILPPPVEPPPIVIPPPVITPGAHEPAGLTVLDRTDWTNDVAPWWRNFATPDKPITTIDVSDGPLGIPSRVLQIGYNAGHQGGGGTELGRWLTPKVNELYWRYQVRVNSGWQGHSSGINKMVYLHDDPGTGFSAMWYEMFGSGQSPLDLYVVNQTGQDIGYHGPANFTRGVWHNVEILQRQGQPGRVSVWVDNALVLDTPTGTKASPIGLAVISGIWGGVGDSKLASDWMQFGPMYLSGR